MTESCKSRNQVPIRLTDERWAHIVEEHCELAGLREEVLQTIEHAEEVRAGGEGELLAIRLMEPGKALVVIDREIGSDDGFIITAFLTRRLAALGRRTLLWPPQT
jgi:hypothetical protein